MVGLGFGLSANLDLGLLLMGLGFGLGADLGFGLLGMGLGFCLSADLGGLISACVSRWFGLVLC